jgi:hypothetical protein
MEWGVEYCRSDLAIVDSSTLSIVSCAVHPIESRTIAPGSSSTFYAILSLPTEEVPPGSETTHLPLADRAAGKLQVLPFVHIERNAD